MELKSIHISVLATSVVHSNRSKEVFVWSVWLVMLVIAFVSIAQYGRNIPLAEDWYFVQPLTGNEPDLAKWLWAQNNEHRIPLPRLILLVLLELAKGDFRVGMFFNSITLGVLAFSMILVARHLRGGRTSFADAFFPIALLHLGNWPNLVWSWQFTFVLPTALTCAVLLVIVIHQTLSTPSTAVVAGTCLVLLPLCGANGLLFVPLLALWLIYSGVLNWYSVKTKGGRQWISGFLIGSAVISLCLTALYFVGYEHPSWNPPSPGLGATLKATAKFLALSFGPVAARSWYLSVIAVVGFLLVSGGLAVLGVLRHKCLEKHRALGVLLFFGNIALFAIVMGWGRAGLIPTLGLPIRYVLFAVPALCTAFFVWELYGSPKLRTVAQMGLLVVMCLLLPFNMIEGLRWGDWYRKGMEAVEHDILAGTSHSILATRHRDFLIHWWTKDQLAAGMQMLKDTGIGPFVQMKEEPGNLKEDLTK